MTDAPDRSTGSGALDPDRLASLEDERDFLLTSLDDLEAEYAAGDIDADDYQELTEDYTVRAAEAIRAIELHRSELAESARPKSRVRMFGWLVGLVGLALVAGLLLARAAGERGVDGQITGSIEESVRDHVLRCQQMGADPSQLLDSLNCFDQVLDRDPRNVEAMTYRGWYVVLAAGTAQQAGEVDASIELLASAQASLQQAVDTDPTYPDARAFRAIVFDRLGERDLACEELSLLETGSTPPMIEQLVAPLSERLAC